MTIKYLTDEKGNTTDVQLSVEDYIDLMEKANEYPDFVKAGIRRGIEQAHHGMTKSTDEVMAKYNDNK